MNARLRWLCEDFERWAAAYQRKGGRYYEDGWETNFAEYTELMRLGQEAMTPWTMTSATLACLETCWAISTECNEMLDYARQNLDRCWKTLVALSQSQLSDVRWQVYEALEHAGPRAEPYLRRGLDDLHEYCRRRALLALANLKPPDARAIAERFLKDADPYMRQASIPMVLATGDPEFVAQVRQMLLQDPVDHVRNDARRELPE